MEMVLTVVAEGAGVTDGAPIDTATRLGRMASRGIGYLARYACIRTLLLPTVTCLCFSRSTQGQRCLRKCSPLSPNVCFPPNPNPKPPNSGRNGEIQSAQGEAGLGERGVHRIHRSPGRQATGSEASLLSGSQWCCYVMLTV